MIDPVRSDPAKVLLVDLRTGLAQVSVDAGAKQVVAGAGASLDDIHESLKASRLALAHSPAVGAITIGGALAIGAHGSAVPARGETPRAGWSFGSLSKAVVSVEAVIWDASAGRYVVATIPRSDPRSAALLCHLGRAIITRVRLAAGSGTKTRCQSSTAYSMDSLCAAPGTWTLGSTASSLLDRSGRLEILLFPFTGNPWVKVWTLALSWPLLSRTVSGPYNYGFADNPPAEILNAATGAATPLLGQLMLTTTTISLLASFATDLWGDPADVQRYVRPSTLKEHEAAWVVVCRRADVQRVLSDFWRAHKSRLSAYASRGSFPVNGPIEIRVNSVDSLAQAPAGAVSTPALAATAPVAGRPELDTVVWLSILTKPGTPDAARFFDETESWLFTNSSAYAVPRVEWSKQWAYTAAGAFTDTTMLSTTIPASYGPAYAAARAALNAMDPQRIFSSPLLDQVLP